MFSHMSGISTPAHQPNHPKQICNPNKEAVKNAVFGLTGHTRTMSDRNRHNPTALTPDKGRHKSVHMVEERQAHKQVTIDNFYTTATVWMIITKHCTADRSGKGRCPPPHASIFARHAHAGSHPLGRTDIQQGSFKSRQIRGNILTITIQNSDQWRTRPVKGCAQSCRLARASFMG